MTAGDVVIATNGYTGRLTPALRRRVVPIASHIIATEKLPADLARSLIPKDRSLSDTKRVLCYYRMSPDGTRMVFGGRARFTPANPELCARVLHRYMTDASRSSQGCGSRTAGPAIPLSRSTRCRIWARKAGCTTASAATAAASR